jgi:hypothetical protein
VTLLVDSRSSRVVAVPDLIGGCLGTTRGKGEKTVLIPLRPDVARAIDRAVDDRDAGPIHRNAGPSRGTSKGSRLVPYVRARNAASWALGVCR